MKIKLSNAEVTRFDNSEIRVRIEEDVKHDTCVIIQSSSNPSNSNLMELFLMADALRREEARKVIAMIPYFGYARQDIQHRPGECVSANVIIRFLESIGIYKVYTFNLHDEATEGVFDIPFKKIFLHFQYSVMRFTNILIKKILKLYQIILPLSLQIKGGLNAHESLAMYYLDIMTLISPSLKKKRDLENKHQSAALSLYGDVKDKTAIIVDDVATSGSTLINSAHFALDQGATSVIAAIVHRDFAPGAADKIQNSKILIYDP